MPFFRFLYSFFEFFASKFMHLNGSSCLFQTWNRYLELTLPVKFLLFRNHSRKEKYVEIIRTVDLLDLLMVWFLSKIKSSLQCLLQFGNWLWNHTGQFTENGILTVGRGIGWNRNRWDWEISSKGSQWLRKWLSCFFFRGPTHMYTISWIYREDL